MNHSIRRRALHLNEREAVILRKIIFVSFGLAAIYLFTR